MVLTSASLARYLLARGLVDRSSLIDGDLRVYNLTRRNRAFRVRCGSHPGYIIKQVKEWKPSSIETLEHEADFYARLRNEPGLARLQRFVPKCYAYDAENQVLVFEVAQALDSGGAAHMSPEVARVLGESLRQWHQEARAGGIFRDLDEYNPWVLAFHLRSPAEVNAEFNAAEAANAELLRLVRREDAFGRAFEALRGQWQPDTLIHGDMKMANCMFSPASGAPCFIDWEFAGWGDPLWDVAGLMQEYVAAWAREECSIAEAALAVRALWEAYGADAESRRRHPAHALSIRRRAIGYSAARIIQSAYEHQDKQKEMTASAVRLLQVALNLLTAPDEAIAVFFETA